MTTKNKWAIADHISDEIVLLINKTMEPHILEALKTGDVTKVDPMQVFIGQLLGLMSTFQTMPPAPLWPSSLVVLRLAVEVVLNEFVGVSEEMEKRTTH